MSSFVPGMSFQGVVADKPKKAAETRITVDRNRNILFVTAELDTLAMVAKVVEAVDVPSANEESAFALEIRRYEVLDGTGGDLANQISTLFGSEKGFLIAGNNATLVARGTAEQHDRIEKILARLKRAETKLTAFPIGDRDAELLVLQLDKLFGMDGEGARPTFIADPVGHNILVRGTSRQIEEIRQFLEKGELRFKPR
jgi:type II secretory pathway component GspD/PulD (secretin)